MTPPHGGAPILSGGLRRFHRASGFLAILLAAPVSAQRVLVATEELRVDGAALDLSAIGPMAVSRSGRVAISQDQDQRVLFVSPEGAATDAFGRGGDGPGEFRMVSVLGWSADTVPVADVYRRQLTMIGPDDRLVRTEPYISVVRPPPGARGEPFRSSYVLPRAILPDGGQLAFLGLARGMRYPAWLPAPPDGGMLFVVLAHDGTLRRIVGYEPGDEACVFRAGGYAAPLPFCDRPLVATSPDGHFLVSLFPDPGGGHRLVQVSSSGGDTLFILRLRRTPVRLPRPAIDSALAGYEAKGVFPPAFTEAIRRQEFPEHYPPFRNILVSNDGSVWVEDFPTGESHRHVWSSYDSAGRVRGRLILPSTTDLRVAEKGRLWAVVTDEDGLEDLVRYRVR